MIFKGLLSVDPSEITKIKKVEPKSIFKKILHTLSHGKISEKIEQENFTAFSIIMQLQDVLHELKIDNLVRLSHNNENIYLDRLGRTPDLDLTIDNYKLGIHDEKSKQFECISLVMEHEEDSFHYFIEIKVNRNHKVGEYPIEVRVNGTLLEMYSDTFDPQKAKRKMDHIFRSQDAYEFYLNSKLNEFAHFLTTIGHSMRDKIAIDDYKTQFAPILILPKRKFSNEAQLNFKDYKKEPIFHGYFKSTERMMYAFLWAEMCKEHEIYVKNTQIYSETGNYIGHLESQGIDAGDSPLFDFHTDYAQRIDQEKLEKPTKKLEQEDESDWF